jgi:hypothetical protein
VLQLVNVPDVVAEPTAPVTPAQQQ